MNVISWEVVVEFAMNANIVAACKSDGESA